MLESPNKRPACIWLTDSLKIIFKRTKGITCKANLLGNLLKQPSHRHVGHLASSTEHFGTFSQPNPWPYSLAPWFLRCPHLKWHVPACHSKCIHLLGHIWSCSIFQIFPSEILNLNHCLLSFQPTFSVVSPVYSLLASSALPLPWPFSFSSIQEPSCRLMSKCVASQSLPSLQCLELSKLSLGKVSENPNSFLFTGPCRSAENYLLWPTLTALAWWLTASVRTSKYPQLPHFHRVNLFSPLAIFNRCHFPQLSVLQPPITPSPAMLNNSPSSCFSWENSSDGNPQNLCDQSYWPPASGPNLSSCQMRERALALCSRSHGLLSSRDLALSTILSIISLRPLSFSFPPLPWTFAQSQISFDSSESPWALFPTNLPLPPLSF